MPIVKGEFVVVVYDKKPYPEMIMDVSKEEVLGNAFHQCRGGWHWPHDKDEIWYPLNAIKKISHPFPANDRGVFKFKENIFE